ncbi:MAG: glucose-6-phosphate isomerase [Gammaproteobacteria bacterium]|nr:glucose-6-phosphate isomerase [Gammaproteobacteria bacterium]
MPKKYTERQLSARYPTDLPAWQALKKHHSTVMRDKTLGELFARDKQRPENCSMRAGDLLLDYSKTHVNSVTKKLLYRLAREADVPAAIEAMFAGDRINVTEGRSVLHVALRAKMSDTIALVAPGVRDVWQVLTKMEEFVDAVHANMIRGHTGKRLTHIVNIGIGGSDLGPVMAAKALRPFWSAGMRFHSVSNIDGTQLADLKAELDPATTLFVVCSKTFTTIETMTNANAARQWVVQVLGEGAVAAHFVAASTNHAAMDEFGIAPDRRFGFWDWVGGRYSLWSAIGLSLALVTGMKTFRRLLAGGRTMDQHFRISNVDENMPVTLAMLGIWYNNFFGAESQAILPYDNRLERFPAYLQQLQMESSGKSVRADGKPVKCTTGMVIWGESGNNAQHSFYQLLHQGTRLIPVDFLLPAKTSAGTQVQHNLAIANCLAQSEALMDGFSEKGTEPYRVHRGNNPSNTILFERLTPEVLGQLIALYEHKVFVEGVIWGINSFDQFGVELGKKLAGGIRKSANPSTKFLVSKLT